MINALYTVEIFTPKNQPVFESQPMDYFNAKEYCTEHRKLGIPAIMRMC